ncbi:MAG: (Fe-S)-binding protein [Calditrichae bacterium]|nr:(Fe-S)-binding protein [Calditrichia bacterium]
MNSEVKNNQIHKNDFFSGIPLPDYDQLVNCMHCGLCLPACPTYALTGLEKHSPRGRIRMIKAVADKDLEITPGYIQSLDFCLDCQACVTACPAGVEYGQLVEAAHHQISAFQKKSGKTSFLKTVLLNGLFKKQQRLHLAASLLRIYQKIGLHKIVVKSGFLKIFSTKLHELNILSPKVSGYKPYPKFFQKENSDSTGIKVGVVTGCIQDVFFNNVNHDTIDVLAYNGYQVITPANQQCCGSVFGHNGELDLAKKAVRDLIDLFWNEKVEHIIINSAGCGSYMKHYDTLLHDDAVYKDKAAWFVSRVKDVSEFLADQGFKRPENTLNLKVTYHEPCHLVHGQKISNQPREIIKALPGAEFIELQESDWCCGSAGIYNVTHYEDSMKLLDRKMDKIKKSGAQYVVSGNPGCMIQLVYGSNKFNAGVEVIHPVSLLNMFYKGE